MYTLSAQTSLKLYVNASSKVDVNSGSILVSQYSNTTPTLLCMMNYYSFAINKKLKNNRFIELEIGQIKTEKNIIIDAKSIVADTINKTSFQNIM